MTTLKDLENWHFESKPFVWANALMSELICSDKGIALEMSAFQIFHRGHSIFINLFDKPNFHTGGNQWGNVQGKRLCVLDGGQQSYW